ncbi:MAG: VWA domain-containing protein [Proteobacteria bacterium]|nr:VWA domain-containing protein [Pseudomonadota bacterium]
MAARTVFVSLVSFLALSACVHEPSENVLPDRVSVTDATESAPVGQTTTGVAVGDTRVEAQVVEKSESKKDAESVATRGAEDDADLSFDPMPEAEPEMEEAPMEMMVRETRASSPRPMSRPRPAPAKRKMAPAADMAAGGMAGPSIAYAPPPPPPVPTPVTSSTEHYTDYGINGFTDTGSDNLSTFAVDVDTASYTMVRRKLREGYLPPPSSARVEEFVNYFPYEYQRPAAGTPFAVDFEASPSPYNALNHIVRIGVQGKKVAFDQRKSVHLTFLVDVSGSMQSSDKIGLLKKTLKMLTEELEDGDTVAIATYAGRTDVVLAPTPMSQSGEIMRALDRLTAGGSTAMGAGIDLAYGLADKSLVEGAVNRVIVCSDGDANVGQTSHEALSATIRGYAEKGVTLTTVGFGTGNYQDTMMERLANDGDGNYYYIDSEREARRVFVEKLTGTLEVIAKDVKIQVDWDPEDVLAYRLIGYENREVADRDFRNDKVDAGEIGAGHQVTALYEVALRDHVEGSIATVRVRNKAPGPDAPAVERSFELSSEEIAGTFAATSRQFRIATASAGFAELLRQSPHMQEVGYRDVEAIARGAARAEFPEDKELIELIDRAADLTGEGSFVSR